MIDGVLMTPSYTAMNVPRRARRRAGHSSLNV